MKTKFTTFILITLALTQLQAFQIRTVSPIIGDIGYGGSGCPVGTARLEIGHGMQRDILSFIFDNYSVATEGRTMARASCSLTIPIQVPEGYALVLPQISLDGFAKMQVDEEGKLNAEVFWAGAQGDLQTHLLNGNNDGDFSFVVANPSLEQTPCGASVNLRVNTSVLLTGHYNSGSFISVDKMKMKLPLNLVACEN
jgi:hypothetical protein